MKHGKKLLSVLLALAMVLALLPSAAFAAEGEKHITILGTSDMHGNIWGFSYEDSKETDNNGMARLYTYIQQVRAENPNTILIDAGDDIQGTIMTDDIYNKTPEEPHPVVTAMNYMGYDAMTLGNHEFNWGIDTMQKILSQAQFPVLAANVKDASGGFVTGAGWTIVETDGVKVAVIGVVTPDVPIWDGGKEGVEACTYEAANTAVKNAIAEIGDGADVIVVSAHMGMYAEFDEDGGSDSAQKILDDNPEIDVLQVAHNHVVVSETQGDTVIGGVRYAVTVHAHSYTATVTTAATCTTPGVRTYACACGESYTEEIPATGHSYVRTEENGNYVYTCSACGDSYTEPVKTATYDSVSRLTYGGRYVLTVYASGGYYAMTHDGTTIGAQAVTIENGRITSDVTESMLWDYSNGCFSFQSGTTTYYLYKSGNSSLRISTSGTSVSYWYNRLGFGNAYLRYSNGSFYLTRWNYSYCYLFQEMN